MAKLQPIQPETRANASLDLRGKISPQILNRSIQNAKDIGETGIAIGKQLLDYSIQKDKQDAAIDSFALGSEYSLGLDKILDEETRNTAEGTIGDRTRARVETYTQQFTDEHEMNNRTRALFDKTVVRAQNTTLFAAQNLQQAKDSIEREAKFKTTLTDVALRAGRMGEAEGSSRSGLAEAMLARSTFDKAFLDPDTKDRLEKEFQQIAQATAEGVLRSNPEQLLKDLNTPSPFVDPETGELEKGNMYDRLLPNSEAHSSLRKRALDRIASNNANSSVMANHIATGNLADKLNGIKATTQPLFRDTPDGKAKQKIYERSMFLYGQMSEISKYGTKSMAEVDKEVSDLLDSEDDQFVDNKIKQDLKKAVMIKRAQFLTEFKADPVGALMRENDESMKGMAPYDPARIERLKSLQRGIDPINDPRILSDADVDYYTKGISQTINGVNRTQLLNFESSKAIRDFTLTMNDQFKDNYKAALNELFTHPGQYKLNQTDMLAAYYVDNEKTHHFLIASSRIPDEVFSKVLTQDVLDDIKAALVENTDFKEFADAMGDAMSPAMMIAYENLAKTLAYKEVGAIQDAEVYLKKASDMLQADIHRVQVETVGHTGSNVKQSTYFGGNQPNEEQVQAMNFNLNSRAFFENLKVRDLESIRHDESLEFYTKHVYAVHSKSGKYRLVYSSGGLENPVLDTSKNPIEITREQLLTDEGADSRTLIQESELNNNRTTGVSGLVLKGRDAVNKVLIENVPKAFDKLIEVGKKAIEKIKKESKFNQGAKELLEVVDPIVNATIEDIKKDYDFTESEARAFKTATEKLHAKLANIEHLGKKDDPDVYKKLVDDIERLIKRGSVVQVDEDTEAVRPADITLKQAAPKAGLVSEPANSETATAITKLSKPMKNKVVNGIIKKAEGGGVSRVRDEGTLVNKLWDEIKDEFKKNPSDEVLKALFDKYNLPYGEDN